MNPITTPTGSIVLMALSSIPVDRVQISYPFTFTFFSRRRLTSPTNAVGAAQLAGSKRRPSRRHPFIEVDR